MQSTFHELTHLNVTLILPYHIQLTCKFLYNHTKEQCLNFLHKHTERKEETEIPHPTLQEKTPKTGKSRQ